MTDQDINNLTPQDLKLITKLAYRGVKKGWRVIYQTVLPQLKKLQSYPNGFNKFNSQFNADTRSHKYYLPEVWQANKNKQIIQNIMKSMSFEYLVIG